MGLLGNVWRIRLLQAFTAAADTGVRWSSNLLCMMGTSKLQVGIE
jgi:hypothetical protein